MNRQLLHILNHGATRAERMAALDQLLEQHRAGTLPAPPKTEYVNNHIHTIYSFSPYSPAGAAYTAWVNGLPTAGIMDHDSVAGAEEFVEAGQRIGIATTVGFECRCSLAGTPFAGRRVNNPDQDGVAYLAMHGIPHQNIGRVQSFITPYRERRNTRNRKMTARLNRILAPCGLELDFDRDIAPISQAAAGGSITERHILYALAGKLLGTVGTGQPLLEFLSENLRIEVGGSNRDRLLDPAETMADYYLLGVLKSRMVERFYIEADDELPHITQFVELAEEVGAIAAYAYLGDVKGSVTGDKKDQTFEDAYLDELVAWLADTGFRGLTYMPTRNTPEQLRRIMGLCDAHGLFQISGEDINSPFQSFLCKALDRPEFHHLVTATWALIGHERAATARLRDGMFTPETMEKLPGLAERIAYFEKIGRA